MSVLLDVLRQGKSPIQVVSFAKGYLKQNGFEECDYKKAFAMAPGGKYLIT